MRAIALPASALLLLLLLRPVPIPAQEAEIVVKVGEEPTASVVPGKEITLPVIIDLSDAGALELADLELEISWDASLLSFVATGDGDFGNLSVDDSDAGNGTISASLTSGGTTSSFTLLSLTLEAGGTEDGTAVSAEISAATSGSGSDLLPNVRARRLLLCIGDAGLFGDATGDGQVNIIDAQQIARFAVGLSVDDADRIRSRGDVTGDEAVNVVDAQQVARFSVGLPSAERIENPAPGGCDLEELGVASVRINEVENRVSELTVPHASDYVELFVTEGGRLDGLTLRATAMDGQTYAETRLTGTVEQGDFVLIGASAVEDRNFDFVGLQDGVGAVEVLAPERTTLDVVGLLSSDPLSTADASIRGPQMDGVEWGVLNLGVAEGRAAPDIAVPELLQRRTDGEDTDDNRRDFCIQLEDGATPGERNQPCVQPPGTFAWLDLHFLFNHQGQQVIRPSIRLQEGEWAGFRRRISNDPAVATGTAVTVNEGPLTTTKPAVLQLVERGGAFGGPLDVGAMDPRDVAVKCLVGGERAFVHKIASSPEEPAIKPPASDVLEVICEGDGGPPPGGDQPPDPPELPRPPKPLMQVTFREGTSEASLEAGGVEAGDVTVPVGGEIQRGVKIENVSDPSHRVLLAFPEEYRAPIVPDGLGLSREGSFPRRVALWPGEDVLEISIFLECLEAGTFVPSVVAEAEPVLGIDPLDSDDFEVECVSQAAPEVASFEGTQTSRTAVEFTAVVHSSGSLSNLELEFDYGDGESDVVETPEETGDDEFTAIMTHDYESTGERTPEVTATNTETGESDSQSFGIDEAAITIQKDGSGTGGVEGDVEIPRGSLGIVCPPDCETETGSFHVSSVPGFNLIFTFTATASEGSVFTGWSGDLSQGEGCDGTGDCTVPINGDRTITATFESETGDGDELPVGLFEFPLRFDELPGPEALYRLYQRPSSSSSGSSALQASRLQVDEKQFGTLSGKLPVGFSGENGFILVDLLTDELLLSGISSSFPIGSPAFGVVGLTETPPGPDSPATVVLFGETGFGFYNTEFGGINRARQPTAFDAFPAGGNPESGYAVGIQEGVVFIGFDEANGDHDIREVGSPASDFEGEPISAWMPDGFDPTVIPALVLARDSDPDNELESGVYVESRNDDPAVRAADVGLDARRIRCAPNGLGAYICAVTVFGDDQLALLTWDGTSSLPGVVATTPVGDGPVDLDMRLLPDGDVGVVTTGFNDNTVTLLELDTGGSVVSSTTRAVPTGCLSPAHAIFIRDAASLKVVGTCTGSDNYFVVESGL